MSQGRTNNPRSADKIFSHSVNVEEVPEQGVDVSLSADTPARQALAAADGLAGIASLEADFHVARRGLAQFNVSGTVRAKITQVCVLSLEPFDSDIVEDVDVDFAEPEAVALAVARSSTVLSTTTPDRDPPDTIVDGTIDLGALAAEFLALGLDPYPKKPGVEFAPVSDPEDKDMSGRPFDVLRRLTERS